MGLNSHGFAKLVEALPFVVGVAWAYCLLVSPRYLGKTAEKWYSLPEATDFWSGWTIDHARSAWPLPGPYFASKLIRRRP